MENAEAAGGRNVIRMDANIIEENTEKKAKRKRSGSMDKLSKLKKSAKKKKKKNKSSSKKRRK